MKPSREPDARGGDCDRQPMPDTDLERIGPLAHFAGTREGSRGVNLAPDDDRVSVERNEFRERIVLEPVGLLQNHSGVATRR